MNTTQEEYSRLKELSQTKDGWERIETAWLTLCNKEKKDGIWLAKSGSKGHLVNGFAIDFQTKKFKVGTTYNHLWAHDNLVTLLMKEGLSSCDAEYRVVKGWIGHILDFKFPCIFLADSKLFFGLCLVQELEESILEQGVGLPLSRLFFEKYCGTLEEESE